MAAGCQPWLVKHVTSTITLQQGHQLSRPPCSCRGATPTCQPARRPSKQPASGNQAGGVLQHPPTYQPTPHHHRDGIHLTGQATPCGCTAGEPNSGQGPMGLGKSARRDVVSLLSAYFSLWHRLCAARLSGSACTTHATRGRRGGCPTHHSHTGATCGQHCRHSWPFSWVHCKPLLPPPAACLRCRLPAVCPGCLALHLPATSTRWLLSGCGRAGWLGHQRVMGAAWCCCCCCLWRCGTFLT
jgi:hypothetical protein